jgi:lipid-binding SYLF domain-containing protein
VIERFRKAGAGELIDAAYGYAVFPTIGKGGIGIGGAHASGRVYKGKSKLMGETKMTQTISGLQLGGQAFSQLILFEYERSFDEFTGGNFEFGAQITALALTAGA